MAMNELSEYSLSDGGSSDSAKRFAKKDEGFICLNCGREVLPLKKTSRNHCPFCLWSLHVDINPGDRANECRGLLRPVAAVADPRKGYIIIHKCEKCSAVVRNKAAYEVKVQPDDLDLIIELTAHSFEYPCK